MLKQIRAFFDARDFLEVNTPLLSISTNTDVHIQSITATVNRQTMYLQTSPEFAMKRLLVGGSGCIYQVAHAFRDEEKGRRHQPEFTLLEWYSLGFDYQQLMDQVQQLIDGFIDAPAQFEKITYHGAFKGYLQLDIDKDSDDTLRACVNTHINGVDSYLLSRADCLDLLISEVIAKQFKGFTFVYDFPSQQASLARLKPDNPKVAERFELFYQDMELANGFTELTDAREQRARFEADNQKRIESGLSPYPVDEDFLQALEQGMPNCAGVALGLDRLLMVLLQKDSIQEVQSLVCMSDQLTHS
jgi:elongation factor P--(R)-beta-lysine ligase